MSVYNSFLRGLQDFKEFRTSHLSAYVTSFEDESQAFLTCMKCFKGQTRFLL